MWMPISTFKKPTTEWDYDQPKALFFSEDTGPVIGRCVLRDSDDKEYGFYYDRDGLELTPTHWMPLPANP